MDPIRPQPGSAGAVAGYVGRVRTTQIARRRLLDGTNLALTDPRRMGKTYWMKYFCATTEDFSALLIDYEGVRTAEEFLVRTGQSLGRKSGLDRARTTLRSWFDNLEEVSVGPVTVRKAVRSLGPTRLLTETVMAVSDLAAHGRPVLVCMDEVPLAIRNIATNDGAGGARELLQTLRSLRAGATNIRWVVCGSVGFHHVLRQCETTEGDVNDLDNLPLGPLTTTESTELATRLMLGIHRQPNAGAIEMLVESSGGIPFLLHKIASLLQDVGAGPVGADDVRRAFDDFVADRDESRALVHFLTRLDPNYGIDAKPARDILDALAATPGGLSWDHLSGGYPAVANLSDVVDFLINDHYLIERDEVVAWRYDVLRRMWARWRRLG